ncbi:MAG TPA: thiamine-phosphate kinase [Polyangiaceae bacterium]|nr:thiamine-phosphate kinase [Polyangiaceae bacterium]
MAALNERRLVALLDARFRSAAPGVQLGIGDDAAVLAAGSEPWVCSVDACVQGVHFDLRFLTLADVGYRSFQAAISDLAAMGATPVAALSALVLPKALSAADIDQLTAGQADASRETACPIVGGNLSRGAELSVTTTVLGRASRPIPRSGARPGEELWLVGELGMAAAGLSALRLGRPRQAAAGVASEPSAALARCILAWRRPRALLAEGRALLGRASAVIDVSDGLLADAPRLSEQSRVRVIIERDRLRATLTGALRGAARELGRSALRLALSGGEDYALLATGPRALRPPGARRIGYVARGSGAFLADGSGRRPLRGGYDHLRR